MPQHLEGEGLGQGHQGRDGARKGFSCLWQCSGLLPGPAMLVVFSVACDTVKAEPESPRTQCPKEYGALTHR